MKQTGGCHCGAVRYEVDLPELVQVSQCNCSVCEKSGYLGVIVPARQFRLLQGTQALRTYTFNTGAAQHHFCEHCGIKSFYAPRSHPDGISVNFRCLDNVHELKSTTGQFDGRQWERSLPQGRATSYPNALD